MSICIFYLIVIGCITLISPGFCFRCYVCNSNSDEYCNDGPRRIARCPHLAAGCVKLINQMIEYKFVNSTGGEITVKEWDGSDTNWKAIHYVKRVVTRRCGNNYVRYQPQAGCRSIPIESTNKSKEIICYCKSELCNRVVKNETNKFLYYVFLIFMPLYVF